MRCVPLSRCSVGRLVLRGSLVSWGSQGCKGLERSLVLPLAFVGFSNSILSVCFLGFSSIFCISKSDDLIFFLKTTKLSKKVGLFCNLGVRMSQSPIWVIITIIISQASLIIFYKGNNSLLVIFWLCIFHTGAEM